MHENYCGAANAYKHWAFAFYKSKRYRAAYKATVAGLEPSDQRDDLWQHMRDGFLPFVKGLAEQNLPEGDSQTDLNQANALLVKC